MNAQEIIIESVKRGIPVAIGYNKLTEQIYYEVSGFAKSGNVRVEDFGDIVKVTARYDEIDEINTFEDLARVAKYWYDSYKDRGYSIDGYWLNVFLEYGWVKRVVKTTYT
jgi:hypothetical protein